MPRRGIAGASLTSWETFSSSVIFATSSSAEVPAGPGSGFWLKPWK
jgi:hypothetical protein